MSKCRCLAESVEILVERVRRGQRIGPGPRGKTYMKVGRFKCVSAGKYLQRCVDRKTKRAFTTSTGNPSQKKAYNRLYKKWSRTKRGLAKLQKGWLGLLARKTL